ncbi:MAG: ABC transporter permease subunit [Candidatus Aminicenantes bacterium]|nr:ABC transporter permease subunit [Candidatus Aminicenantes bacterium]
MNVFRRELRANRRSLIFWCLGMALIILTAMGKYAGMAAAGEQSISDFIKMMPASVQAVMGMSGLDLSDARSFFVVIYMYVALMAAIHASMLGAVIIAKEERDRTSEFLFVKPMTRAGIVTSKLLAAVTNAAVLNLVTFAVSFAVMGQLAKGQPFAAGLARMMLGLFLLQLLFLSVGSASAAIIGRPRASTGVAAGIMLFTFLLSSAIDINSDWDVLKFLTPFKYFPARDMMLDGGFTVFYVALAVGVAAVLTVAAYYFFKRRDLRV